MLHCNSLCCRGWQIGNRKQLLKIHWNYKPYQNSKPFLETVIDKMMAVYNSHICIYINLLYYSSLSILSIQVHQEIIDGVIQWSPFIVHLFSLCSGLKWLKCFSLASFQNATLCLEHSYYRPQSRGDNMSVCPSVCLSVCPSVRERSAKSQVKHKSGTLLKKIIEC